MDQDSTNGAGPDKRNWRERLGIGAKELPKLSDEFRDVPQMSTQPPPPAGTAKPAPRAPVTKPAPMAPRVAARPAQPPEVSTAPSMPPTLSRATPKGPDNAAQDALAEKLRAQRAAAERLAEQRVQAARSRAEGKKADPVPPPRPTTPPTRGAAGSARTPGLPVPPAGAPRPKFSFADDNRSETGQRPGLTAPLTPPRPALGGDRAPPPFLRPSAAGSLGARPQPAFRQTTTESGSGYVAPPRLLPPGTPRTGLGTDAPGYGASRLPVRRAAPALEPYTRAPQPEPRDFPEDDLDDDGRAAPRLGRPGAPLRGRSQDDFDEVFEDEQPQRSRATARDYQSAYDEGDEGFADEPRRSSGPWLLLLALLAAAVLTGAVVWFYSDSVRHLAGVGSSSSSGSTPVVTAPVEPAKVAAPDSTAGDGQTEAPAARKKQIYDRIVGEQEVTGEMQPTEETPVPPEAAQPDAAAQPAADQVPKIEPTTGNNQIPAPDAPSQGTTGQGLPDPEPPPPLPIPGADGTQGNLGLKGGQQVAAAAAQPGQGGSAPPPLIPSSTQTSSSNANPPPPPGKATDGAALVSGVASSDAMGGATPPAASADPAVTAEPDTQTTPPAASTTQNASQPAATPPTKKKAPAKKAASKQTSSKQANYDNLGSKPVVLVPPSQQAAAQSQKSAVVSQPVTTAPATAEQPADPVPPPQKRKSIFDLFTGTSGGTATTTNAPAPAQVASVATQTKQTTPPAAATQKAAPASPPAASTGGGYVIQLASFRTDAEAKSEYSRLAGAYPSVVGPLKSQIRQTNVGGSPRYQLGLGPLPTRGDATRVCGELIAAGESDCIVRGP